MKGDGNRPRKRESPATKTFSVKKFCLGTASSCVSFRNIREAIFRLFDKDRFAYKKQKIGRSISPTKANPVVILLNEHFTCSSHAQKKLPRDWKFFLSSPTPVVEGRFSGELARKRKPLETEGVQNGGRGLVEMGGIEPPCK